MSLHFSGRLNNCLGKVYAKRHEITDRFYELLFDDQPDVKAMFKGDFHKQKEMFSMMIAMLARCSATGQDPVDMGRQIRDQHKSMDIAPELFVRAGVILRQAFIDELGDEIGDFEKALLTDSIGRLTASINGQVPCGSSPQEQASEAG
ncbi:MAG: hypothetical protein R3D85_05725 [Paracoccaceae bacterium]